MTLRKKQLVILISGSGSNLQAFIDRCASGELDAEIACVISNKASAYGLERAKQAGIPVKVIDHKAFPSREAFDAELADAIDAFQPDVVILAGFMRILTEGFVRRFLGRLLNIHPSLLPKYPGLHTHQRAMEAGDRVAGATVHFVTPELDGGPPIIQAEVPVDPNDTADRLAARVLEKEHVIYPLAVTWLLSGCLELRSDGAYLDQRKLPVSGCQHAG